MVCTAFPTCYSTRTLQKSTNQPYKSTHSYLPVFYMFVFVFGIWKKLIFKNYFVFLFEFWKKLIFKNYFYYDVFNLNKYLIKTVIENT